MSDPDHVRGEAIVNAVKGYTGNCHAFCGGSTHVVVELDPLPRFACRYSAANDHGPLNMISTPPPATQPVEVKFLLLLNEAVGLVDPVGVKLSVLLCDPPVMTAPALR